MEFVYHQSSLNGHQATIDCDGRFRAMICLEDPGLANWLDPAGSLQGMIIFPGVEQLLEQAESACCLSDFGAGFEGGLAALCTPLRIPLV